MDIHFLLIRNNLTFFHIIKNNLENFIAKQPINFQTLISWKLY